MEDVKIDINSAQFPNQFVSDAEKATNEFGLQIGQAIQYEWFKKDGSNCRYYSNQREYHRLRLYARGEQPIGKYKNELAVEGDLSYLNLDWTPVPVLPKFVDIVVNGMQERVFDVKTYSQDAISQSRRSEYQTMIEGQMVAKPLLEKIQEKTGVNPFTTDPAELPESNEELKLYMQLNYKPAIEIAEEEAINTLFESNHYNDVKKRLDYDQTVLGKSFAKQHFLPGAGVKIEYVDPANLVHSYTEDPNFKDCFYWGEVKTVPVAELVQIDPTLTNSQLEEIGKYSQSWYNYYRNELQHQNSLFSNDTTTLLYFNYKTTKKVVYKKKIKDNGNVSMIKKDDSFNPPTEMMEENNFEKVEKTIDVWYEGVMVMGTNIVLKWNLMENMIRPQSATQYSLPNYIGCAPRMYKGVVESLVRRMIPFADLIQITHLKLQQVISRTVPDGVFIDADGLNEVDLGTGNAYNPEDALRMYFQTGSVIGRSYTQDGDFNQARVPIKELQSTSGASKASMLISNYNHYLNQIRTVTGLNEARDASTPDVNSLVGLQKLAAANSNVATRHILQSGLYIYKTLAEALTCRIADILKYSDFKEQFINQIGKYNVSILNDIKDLYIYDFGIFIEVSPDEEEKAQLEANIQMALSRGNIDLDDAIDIREVRNLKVANQLLKLKKKKKLEREEKMAMQKQAMTSQSQLKSQELAAQTAMQKIQAETQSKMQIKQAEIAFEIEKQREEANLKGMLMDKEFSMNIQLAKIQQDGISERENQKEKEKSKRISQANTEQSKLINQRKNNLPPIKFESNEDSLDGFGLNEFDPR